MILRFEKEKYYVKKLSLVKIVIYIENGNIYYVYM